MIDGRQSLRFDLGLPNFQAAPFERRALALELRRRPQTTPDAGRGPALEENRARSLGSSLRNQQGRLPRPAIAPLLSAREFRLPPLARSDAEPAHRTQGA